MTKVYHADLYGLREYKYQQLTKNTLRTTPFEEINPQKPFYLFVPQNTDLCKEYEQYLKITEIMPLNVLGFQSHRDAFAIHFDREVIYQRIDEMRQPISDEQYYQKYKVKDNRDWQLTQARQRLKKERQWENKLIRCLYRPFDWRFCYFSSIAMDYPRVELINHVASKKNLVLNLPRIIKVEKWRHALVSNIPCTAIVMDVNGSYCFPLYLYSETGGEKEMGIEKRPNFSPNALKQIENKLGYLPNIEEIFYYIYAVVHSPTYRSRYAPFLKIDFPRIPLTSNKGLFSQLAHYGAQLVGLHLMNSEGFIPYASCGEGEKAGLFMEKGGNRKVEIGIAKRAYNNGVVKINNQGDAFTGVPEQVWNFYIGAYQVCFKWLKDRKGRCLSNGDIEHYQKIVVALRETISIMGLIDQTISRFPI